MTDDEHASTVVHSSCRLAGDSDHDAQSAHHDAVLALEPAPFLEEWALIAGDCAHNTRTALDVFIWVNSTELPRSARGGVAYPILPFDPEFGEDDAEGCSDRLEDQSSSVRRSIERKIEGLPEPLRSRVLDNIRWSSLVEQGSPIWHQRLPLLQELDNVDKHRLALEVVPTRAMTCLDLRAWAPGGERLKIDYTSDVGRFLERAPNGERQVVASGTTRAPIARLTGKATQTLALRVRTLDLSQSLVETLEEHIDDAEGLLTVLASRDPAPPRPMNIS